MKAIVCLGALSCVLLIADVNRAGPMRDDVLITSRHSVYNLADPIDLTFWIKGTERLLAPSLEIRRIEAPRRGTAAARPTGVAAAQSLVASKAVDGVTLGESHSRGLDGTPRDGPVPTGRNYAETIADLRAWYAVDYPGTYEITFVGETNPTQDSEPEIRSNTLTIQVGPGAEANGGAIPLDEIWALGMPGTRPMSNSIASDTNTYTSLEGPLVDEIAERLTYDPARPPGAAFVVRGSGLEALRKAHAVFVRGDAPDKLVAAGERVSLVFFSREFGSFVALTGVEQRGDSVQILYRFVPHLEDIVTTHLALIPIQVPRSGKLRIEIKPEIDPAVGAGDLGGWARKIICGSSEVDAIARRKSLPSR